MEVTLSSNSSTNLVSTTTNGNPLVSSEHFDVALLDENKNLIVYSEETSALVVLEQKGSKARLTLLETEEDADNLLNSNLLEKAISSESENKDSLISFTFDVNDIHKLLEADDVLLKLVETLNDFKQEVNSEKFLKVVLELKNVFSVDYILEQLSMMSPEDINYLIHSRSVVSEFKNIMQDQDYDE